MSTGLLPTPWIKAGVLLLALHIGTVPAKADESPVAQTCSRSDISVTNANEADLADVCAGAESAIAFFDHLDLRLTEPLKLEVTTHFPDMVSTESAACYLAKRHRILVRPYAAFSKMSTWFNVPIDRDIYRSIVAHETAHAIARCNFRTQKPSVRAHEYLAYVVMFSSMPDGILEQALQSIPASAHPDVDLLSETLYFFNPMRFAAEAFRHYRALEDKDAFVRAVLDGEVLAR